MYPEFSENSYFLLLDTNADTSSYQNILMQACLTIKLKLKKKAKDKEM